MVEIKQETLPTQHATKGSLTFPPATYMLAACCWPILLKTANKKGLKMLSIKKSILNWVVLHSLLT